MKLHGVERIQHHVKDREAGTGVEVVEWSLTRCKVPGGWLYTSTLVVWSKHQPAVKLATNYVPDYEGETVQ